MADQKPSKTNSKFDGGLLGLIGTGIVTWLLVVFTLGIGTPWAVCYFARWFAGHTYIEGKRMKFVGTGGELFVQYIKWFLLTIITIGIYGFWLGIKMTKWVVSNVTLDV